MAATALRAEEPRSIRVNYAGLIDKKAVTHSGRTVGQELTLIRELQQKNKEMPGLKIDITSRLASLEPYLEPLGFLLNDVLEREDQTRAGRRLIDVGGLFPVGSQQPAWADLLRTRHFVVYSDGLGYVRIFVPGKAAKAAYEEHAGVLRHVLNWLWTSVAGQKLTVEVFAYQNDIAATEFVLNTTPHEFTANAELFANQGTKPLDVKALEKFFANGQTIEAAQIADGNLILIGSKPKVPATLDGMPISVADLAVAYRAVRYPGGSPAYMSLDPSGRPETVAVNYGGRLNDTRIGWVTLRCDQRFKTITDGVDPVTHIPVVADIQRQIPDFLTLAERQYQDPKGVGQAEQTRFWFYPANNVDVTRSGGAVRITRARFTAAGERTDAAGLPGQRQAPPWTRDTLKHFNDNYDRFAQSFEEVRELDDVGRLLVLAAWLDTERKEGRLPVDPDALLGVELPACRTPRALNQTLIAYGINAGVKPDIRRYDISYVAEQMAEDRRTGRLDRDWRELGLLQYLTTRAKFEKEILEAAQRVAGVREFKADVARTKMMPADAAMYRGTVIIIGGLDLNFGAKHKGAKAIDQADRERIDRAVSGKGEWTGHSVGSGDPPKGPPPIDHGPAPAPKDPRDRRLVGTTVFAVVPLSDEGGKIRGEKSGPASPVHDGPSRSVFWAENSKIPDFYAVYTHGRSIMYRLSKGEDGTYVATQESLGIRSADADALAAADAIRRGASPHFAWREMIEGGPVLTIERFKDGTVGVLTRGEEPSDPVELRIVSKGTARVAERGAAAIEKLNTVARDYVKTASGSTATFVFAEQSGGKVRIQSGNKAVDVPLDDVEALLANPTHPGKNALDAVFRDANGPKDFVVYRGANSRRPERFGGNPLKGKVDDPEALAFALRARYSKYDVRVHLDDDPVLAVERLKQLPKIANAKDLTLLVRENSFHKVDQKALAGVRPAWKNGPSIVTSIDKASEAKNVAVLTGHNSPELFDYLEKLGSQGVLKDRVWLLLTCGEPGNANMFHELFERYGAKGYFIFPEKLDAEAVSLVLQELPGVLRQAEADSESLSALEILERAVEKVEKDPVKRPSTSLERHLRVLKRGILQLSDNRRPDDPQTPFPKRLT